MPEKLEGLIEKINSEAVEAAESKARIIELEAKKNAENILSDAQKRSQKIIEEANQTTKKTERNIEIVLKQAGRDLILSVKNEIKKMFDKIIKGEVSRIISSEEMAEILSSLIKKYVEKNGDVSDVEVLLKKEDCEKLKGSFFTNLREEIGKEIKLKDSSDINAGFRISFDKGKCYYDFTDEGLAESLSAYLRPEVSKLLK